MSQEEILLELVLDKFSSIKEVLNATKDIENFLKKIKLNKRRGIDVTLEKAKKLVDSLYDHSVKVKEEFYSQYNLLESSIKENEGGQDPIEENISNSDLHVNNGNLECNEHENRINENVSVEEHIEIPVKTGKQKIRSESEENECKETNAEVDDSNNVEEDPLKESDSFDIINSSILDNTDDKGNTDEQESSANKEKKSLIRLVDLSKLIDPKQKKSVKFDSSIIVLTSSDEESKTPKRVSDMRDETSGNLKSALKQTSNNKSRNRVNGENSSGIQDKQPSKDKHSEESDMDESVTQKDNKSRKLSECNKISEISPNLEKESRIKKSKSKHAIKKNDDTSDKEIANVAVEKTKTDNTEEDSENECNKTEEPDEIFSRKSSRIHNNEISKQVKKKRLRKIFNRRPHKSTTSSSVKSTMLEQETNSDSDSDDTVKRKLVRNKKDSEQHLSDTSSSLSGSEITKKSFREKDNKSKRIKIDNTTNSVHKDVDDEKFKYEVYIPLPRIECSQLKEMYLRNKEVFEVKRMDELHLPKKQKRSEMGDNTYSSSDGGKPEKKKSKNHAPKNKHLSGDETTSDDEPLKKPLNNIKLKLVNPVDNQESDQNTHNKDEQTMDITEKIQDSDDKLKSSNELELGSKENNEEQIKNNENAKETSAEVENDEEIIPVEKEKASENEDDKIQTGEKETDSKSQNVEETKGNEQTETEVLTIISDSSDSETELNKQNKKEDQLKKIKKRVRKAIVSSDSEGSGNDKKNSSDNKGDESSDEENRVSDNGKKEEKSKKKIKKRIRNVVVSSDSEGSNKDEDKNSDNTGNDTSDKGSSNSDTEKKEEQVKKKRKRIKRTKDSSSSEEDKSTRKHIRRVIGRDALSETTKQAEAEEKERKARIAEKQKKYNKLNEALTESKVDKVILDYNEKEKKELLTVNKKIVKKLKPHQASGIQFMWDACFESIERATNTKGSGCILAHCMGLGKTLQVITLSHTLLTNVEKTGVHKILVVCPLNTVLNWKSEFKKWLPKEDEFEVYELVSCKQNYERQYIVGEWHSDGGVLIIGYDMFRNLSNPDNKRISKKMRTTFGEGLVDPGPDLVVCDEGHLLKNEKTRLSIAMNRIKTARRIVLTGTPLQNNLKEYWCMVQFIKPNLLGTYKEYLNRFVNPITNGQYTDSTQHDIMIMRQRSHVLHKLLDGVVQRKDYAVLEPYLPPKHEYVLFIKLSETQVKLYSHYMEKFARRGDGSNRASMLFADFQALQRICTHPRVLLDKSNERKEKDFDDESEGSLKDFIDDEGASSADSSDGSSSSSNSDSDNSDTKKGSKSKGKQQRVRVTRAQAAQKRENNEESDSEPDEVKKEWFQEYCDGDELDNINNSGKLFLLFQILKECEEIGDKVLVFSQSLYTLNCIEYFLEKIDEATQRGEPEKVGGHSGSWAIGLDYFRLDGSSSCDNRATWCDMFNNPNNTRARLFLISTKAGGLGINLVAANRVIIFDVSWNPSHDVQSIYRVYRFGQTKPCYIYRFVTYGAMEMKIYERQVIKQAISKRVIDEQQIDRHYNQNDLQELYKCDLEPTDRPLPMVPKDVLLGEMLQKYENTIYKYHLHQSLLENKEEEGLNEEERKAAWEEFENEKVLRKNTGFGLSPMARVNAQAIETALASIVRKDNPTWSDVQIKGIIPALVQQLQVQLAEGDLTMYARVQQEIQIMQEIQAQKLREAYYQQQVMRMIQRQQTQEKMLGNLYVDPAQLARSHQAGGLNMFPGNMMNLGGPSSAPRSLSNDVIELND